MTISINKLVVTGPDKADATLLLNNQSHLVFGPTDTGKSYIVECFRYCLGSDQKPKDVGYSEGYTRAALQISLGNAHNYTLFRDLFDGVELVYEGFHTNPPQDDSILLNHPISDLVTQWGGGHGKRVLIKSGKLGNLTAGDLRRVSIFDEIETLDNAPFEGSDTNRKTRNKSSLAAILSGSDDSEMLLPPSNDERNIAKGHIEAINEQIVSLLSDVPEGITLLEAKDGVAKITAQMEAINKYVKVYASELAALKQSRRDIDNRSRGLFQHISSLREAENRFKLLDKKYISDQQRLNAIATASSVTSSFETRPCPLCHTDIDHQVRHQDEEVQILSLRHAAHAEIIKIDGLRDGLKVALNDVQIDISEVSGELKKAQNEALENDQKQSSLLASENIDTQNGLVALSERKTTLAIAISNLLKIDELTSRLNDMKEKSKRKKQAVDRNMSVSSTALCKRVKTLLDAWGVPGVESVYFDDTVSDIEINQRKRISYGKGKRGIFLTAYMISLMEHAIENGNPHIGITIIDSPLVTYKDPKHSKNAVIDDDLLDDNVKDRFYAWLANRSGEGQILILENEEPNAETLKKLNYTEFVGADNSDGRSGFFPVKPALRMNPSI
jgi:hypothetical protein